MNTDTEKPIKIKKHVPTVKQKAFSKMNLDNKRIAVAHDVLAALKARKIKMVQRHYFVVPKKVRFVSPDVPMAKAVQGIKCQVCAKGALFLSLLDRQNGTTVKGILGEHEGRTDGKLALDDLDNDDILKYMFDIFNEFELDAIETAFENWTFSPGRIDDLAPLVMGVLLPDTDTYSDEWHTRKYKWHMKEKRPQVRLTLIMQNIIKNHGNFVPVADDFTVSRSKR